MSSLGREPIHESAPNQKQSKKALNQWGLSFCAFSHACRGLNDFTLGPDWLIVRQPFIFRFVPRVGFKITFIFVSFFYVFY